MRLTRALSAPTDGLPSSENLKLLSLPDRLGLPAVACFYALLDAVCFEFARLFQQSPPQSGCIQACLPII